MKIEGKKIALTGATGGIGRAIAKALAEEGAILLLSGRNKDKLSSLKSELAGNGHIIVVANLESPSDREKFISVARENRVDILINNAGVNDLAFLPRISEKDLKKMIDINLTIPLLLCKQFLPLLQHQTEGVIINIGSILGSIGYPGSTVYCASKFGLRGFTESLRRELAGTKIRIIYFAPRATDTGLISGRMREMNEALNVTVDTPDQVAAHLITMLKQGSPYSRYLGLPESFAVQLNGIFPKLVDRILNNQLPVIRRFAEKPLQGVNGEP